VRVIPDPVEFETCPEGTYRAICRSVVELDQQETRYKGELSGKRFQVSMAFEPIGPKTIDGAPFTVWRHGLNFSTAEKAAFRPILEALLGRPFRKGEGLDLAKLVGMGCMITIEHKQGGDDGDKTFANIVEFDPWPKSVKLVKSQGEMFFFSLEPDLFDKNLWGLLSKKMQEKIEQSPEYDRLMFGDPDVNEDTALQLAKPSRRSGSSDWHPDANGYYPDGSRTITQEEAEREHRESIDAMDSMGDIPF